MLRVMIIGCGGIGPAHIEGYLRAGEDAQIDYLADSQVERAQAVKEKYHLEGARAVADYREAFGHVDVVSVCTPPATHRDIAVDALRHGCHVLLEKPMAPSLAECDEILRVARENGRCLTGVVQGRFITENRRVTDMVRGGAYGRSLYTQVNSQWYRGDSYYDLAWRGLWEKEGGGCTLVHSIHHIDLLLWTKGMPRTVTSFMTNLAHPNSQEEDLSVSLFGYEDGSVAQVNSGLICHGERQQLVFQMEKAGLTLPFDVMASHPRENGFPDDDETLIRAAKEDYAARPALAHENHEGQIQNFLAHILRGEPLVADGQDARNCIEVITAIYCSAIAGKTVTLPLPAEGTYYTGAWRKDAPHFHEKTRNIDAFADTSITGFRRG